MATKGPSEAQQGFNKFKEVLKETEVDEERVLGDGSKETIKRPYSEKALFSDFEKKISGLTDKELFEMGPNEIITSMIENAKSEKDLIAPMIAHLALGTGNGDAIISMIDIIRAQKMIEAINNPSSDTNRKEEMKENLKSLLEHIKKNYLKENDNFTFQPNLGKNKQELAGAICDALIKELSKPDDQMNKDIFKKSVFDLILNPTAELVNVNNKSYSVSGSGFIKNASNDLGRIQQFSKDEPVKSFNGTYLQYDHLYNMPNGKSLQQERAKTLIEARKRIDLNIKNADQVTSTEEEKNLSSLKRRVSSALKSKKQSISEENKDVQTAESKPRSKSMSDLSSLRRRLSSARELKQKAPEENKDVQTAESKPRSKSMSSASIVTSARNLLGSVREENKDGKEPLEKSRSKSMSEPLKREPQIEPRSVEQYIHQSLQVSGNDIEKHAKLLAADLKKHNLNLLMKIKREELDKKNHKKNVAESPNIVNFIQNGNKIQDMVSMDMLCAQSKEHQERIFDFYLKVARQSKEKGDYTTLFAIMGGLNSVSVSRLMDQNKYQTKEFKSLAELQSPMQNFANLRNAMEKEKKKGSTYIPYNGLYDKDLDKFIDLAKSAEGEDKIKAEQNLKEYKDMMFNDFERSSKKAKISTLREFNFDVSQRVNAHQEKMVKMEGVDDPEPYAYEASYAIKARGKTSTVDFTKAPTIEEYKQIPNVLQEESKDKQVSSAKQDGTVQQIETAADEFLQMMDEEKPSEGLMNFKQKIEEASTAVQPNELESIVMQQPEEREDDKQVDGQDLEAVIATLQPNEDKQPQPKIKSELDPKNSYLLVHLNEFVQTKEGNTENLKQLIELAIFHQNMGAHGNPKWKFKGEELETAAFLLQKASFEARKENKTELVGKFDILIADVQQRQGKRQMLNKDPHEVNLNNIERLDGRTLMFTRALEAKKLQQDKLVTSQPDKPQMQDEEKTRLSPLRK